MSVRVSSVLRVSALVMFMVVSVSEMVKRLVKFNGGGLSDASGG